LLQAVSMSNAHRIPKTAQESLPHPGEVVPFGLYGAGTWTGHPIGLLLVGAIVLIGIVGLPEVRWFLALTIPLGAVCGLALWWRHR
jgi:hypothetical protein